MSQTQPSSGGNDAEADQGDLGSPASGHVADGGRNAAPVVSSACSSTTPEEDNGPITGERLEDMLQKGVQVR